MAEHQQAFITDSEKGFGILEYVKQMSTLDKLLPGKKDIEFPCPSDRNKYRHFCIKGTEEWTEKEEAETILCWLVFF